MKKSKLLIKCEKLPANLCFLKKEITKNKKNIINIVFSVDYNGNFPVNNMYKNNSNIYE